MKKTLEPLHFLASLTSLSAIVALLTFSGAASAAPIQLIANGNFETGTLAGWTSNNTGYADNNFYAIGNGGSVPASGQPTDFLATGGNFVAVSDQNGLGGEELRQAFTVLSGMTNLTLEFDWFNNTHNDQFGTIINGNEQVARMDILFAGAPALDTGAGVAMNLLLLNTGMATPMGSTVPWAHSVFNLTGLAAGTYELRFGNGQCCFYQELGIDNVSLLANPVPEPETYAMLLAGLGLLGFMARRRKNLAA